MPSFLTNLAGGKSIADLKAPRSRRGNTNQVVDYWFGGLVAGGDFESIATVSVGSGGQSTVEFSSIPATYKHLQIRGIARSNRAAFASDPLLIQVNSDTATNYSWHYLVGDGSSASSAAGATQSSMTNYLIANNTVSNVFGAFVIDVLDYANTNIYKTFRSLMGVDNNGSGFISLNSGNWRSTSAITSIKLTAQNGDLMQYSHFALYGIKG